MKITCISDTHTLHKAKPFNADLKECIDKNEYNLLLHAGDISSVGRENEVRDFIYWFQNLQGFDTKIFIAGNHDMSFEATYKPKPDWLRHLLYEENLMQSDCVYLEDNGFTIESPEFTRPLKIYGSPWQPVFLNWAFNLPRNGYKLKEKWALIPDDTNILITHCPPYTIKDSINPGSESLGCEKLKERVDNLNLAVHVFGHIHGGAGVKQNKNTLHINAATCNEMYYPINKPISFYLREIDGELTTLLP